jgi:hypothetical protein
VALCFAEAEKVGLAVWVLLYDALGVYVAESVGVLLFDVLPVFVPENRDDFEYAELIVKHDDILGVIVWVGLILALGVTLYVDFTETDAEYEMLAEPDGLDDSELDDVSV